MLGTILLVILCSEMLWWIAKVIQKMAIIVATMCAVAYGIQLGLVVVGSFLFIAGESQLLIGTVVSIVVAGLLSVALGRHTPGYIVARSVMQVVLPSSLAVLIIVIGGQAEQPVSAVILAISFSIILTVFMVRTFNKLFDRPDLVPA